MSDTVYRDARGLEVTLFHGGSRGPCVQIDDGERGVYVQMTTAQFLDMVRIATPEVRARWDEQQRKKARR